MDRNKLVDLFLSNYSDRDITNLLLDRMSLKEIEKEIESFEAIQKDNEEEK